MGCGCNKRATGSVTRDPVVSPAIKRAAPVPTPKPVNPNPEWVYQVTSADDRREILSEWNTPMEAIDEAKRVGGRAARSKRI